MVKANPVKGPWSPEEDSLLKVLVDEYGRKKWSLIATQFPGRSGKQCRERWLNHLDTRVKKSAWTGAEDVKLCEAQGRLGNKWSEISRLLPGRAENAVKNRQAALVSFNSIITKRLASQGISVKGSGLMKANMAKDLAANGTLSHSMNILKSADKEKLQQQQQRRQQGSGKESARRQARDSRQAPVGFDHNASESDCNSSSSDDDEDEDEDEDDDDDGDMEVYPNQQPPMAFPLSAPPPFNVGEAADFTHDGRPSAGPAAAAAAARGNGRATAANTGGTNNSKHFAAGESSCGGSGITRGANDVGTTAAAAFSNAAAAAAAAAANAVASASAAATAAGTFAAGVLSSSSPPGDTTDKEGWPPPAAAEGGGGREDQLMRSIFSLLGGKPAQRGGFEPARRHHLYDRDGGCSAGAFARSRVPAAGNKNKRPFEGFLNLDSVTFSRNGSNNAAPATGEGAVMDEASAAAAAAMSPSSSSSVPQGRVLEDGLAATGGGGGNRGGGERDSAAMSMAKKCIEEEMETFRQFQQVMIAGGDTKSVQQKEREAFSQLYSSLPALAASQDGGLAMSKAGAAVPTRKAAMEIEAGGGVDVREGQASAITEIWSKVEIKEGEAPPQSPALLGGAPMMRQGAGTRSLVAAVAGGAGGGGPYASLNRHQYHRQNPPRSAVGGNMNNSSSSQAGGGYVNTQHYHLPVGGGGGGGRGVGREGAAVSAAAFAAASSIGGSRNSWSQQLDQLRTDDVIPTPLEIHSPGGGGDILSLSCLGSYLADVKLPSNLDGAGGDGTGQQGTFSATAAGEKRSGGGSGGGSGDGGGSGGGGGDAGAAGESSSEGTAGMKDSSSGGGGDRGGQPGQLMSDPSKGTSTSSGEWGRRNRPPSTAPTPAAAAAAAATTDNGADVKRHAPDSNQRLGRMNIVTGGGGGDRGGGGSDDDDGGGNGGGAALFDAHAAALQHDMQALSIDDEPSPGWSQLRTDVAGYVFSGFGF
ncbi:unnamed protein product [Ectocarpus sp. 13 AM-2016]